MKYSLAPTQGARSLFIVSKFLCAAESTRTDYNVFKIIDCSLESGKS